MQLFRCTYIVVVVVLLLAPGGGTLAGSKTDLPNDVTIELLGKSLIYSFSYQNTIAEQLGLEFGVSVLGGSGGSVTFIYGGPRVYLTPANAAPCIAAVVVGLTASTGSGPFNDEVSTYYFYLGPGFEYRSSSGFLFRGTVYALVRNGFFVWPGVQVGVAF